MVVGGTLNFFAGGEITDTVVIYDPSSNTWSSETNTIIRSRTGHKYEINVLQCLCNINYTFKFSLLDWSQMEMGLFMLMVVEMKMALLMLFTPSGNQMEFGLIS